MIKFIIFCSIFLLIHFLGFGQFPPAAGVIGSTAIHKDSNIIVNWAETVFAFNRGYENISNAQSPLASFGIPENALYAAEGSSVDVVSLGDGGSITLGFPFPIQNGDGPDFVVFENSFNDTYLEFAFVEVSSNGTDFVRFPSTSLIQSNTQTGPFGSSDVTKINNLAGKYRQGYGTPFDLGDIQDSILIDTDSILYIRVVDVVGSIDSSFANFDSHGNIINDPFPTEFASSGFDLDGIGVIHQNNPLHTNDHQAANAIMYPNPTSDYFVVKLPGQSLMLTVYDLYGMTVLKGETNTSIDCHHLKKGLYFIKIESKNDIDLLKLVIN